MTMTCVHDLYSSCRSTSVTVSKTKYYINPLITELVRITVAVKLTIFCEWLCSLKKPPHLMTQFECLEIQLHPPLP